MSCALEFVWLVDMGKKKKKLRLQLATIKQLWAVQTEPEHVSNLRLEHAASPGQTAAAVKVKTYLTSSFTYSVKMYRLSPLREVSTRWRQPKQSRIQK